MASNANFSRRSVLTAGVAGLLGTGALASCGNDTATKSSSTTTAAGSDGSGSGRPLILTSVFPEEGYAVTGSPQRLPFEIAGSDGAPLDKIDGKVDFTLSYVGPLAGTPTTAGVTSAKPAPLTATAVPRSAGLPRAYLPVEITFDQPGYYEITGDYHGRRLTTTVGVNAPGGVTFPARGSKLPSVDTPTTTDARGVDPICTRDPACPFHTVNLADSLKAGRPVALLISTPAYCQVAICGPVLDVLIAAAKGRTDIDVIHAEVYANPTKVDNIAKATPAPIVTAFGMEFEPCLFVVDRTGAIVDRYDAIYDADQAADAIALAVR